MQVDSSLDNYNNDGRDSDMSIASVQKYALNEKGIFRSKKTNFIVIANESKYDLIIVMEIDGAATHLADGRKVDKKRDGTPIMYTIAAGRSDTLEIKTKISYITALRRHPTLPGYYVIRSKKYLKRSSKWTATTKSVEKATNQHVDEKWLNNLQAIKGTAASSSVVPPAPASHAKSGPRLSSVDDEPRIPDNLKEQLLKKEQQNRQATPAAHHDEDDKNSVEEGGSDDGVESSSGGQTHHLNLNDHEKARKGKSSCCGCCCC